MAEIYEPSDDKDVGDEDIANENDWGPDLNEDAAPEPIGVYERPDRTQGVSVSLIVAIVILLLLIVVAYFIFFV